MAQEPDRISQLPAHIVGEILSRLPIKEAGRTSVLSRKWRYNWRSLPRLTFDNQCTMRNVHRDPSQNLVKIIDRVLMLHSGPIEMFKLHHTGFSAIRDIDHWMLHLSKVTVKQIILFVCTREKYKIPTFFFNCQHLTSLQLYGCSVNIPSSFKGFKNLYYLYLECVELSPYELEALISRCPLLVLLSLKNLQRITRLNLEAAHDLKWLEVRGAFVDVVFGVKNHLKLYWALGNVPQTLPYALVHLKYLSTCIDFTSEEQILTVICLIRSSPQLKKIEFQNPRNRQTRRIETMAGFWKIHRHSCCLEQVEVISMKNIFGAEPELEFMKFLLTSLPNLQTMMIQPSVGIVEVKLLKELLQFQRFSAQAQVIVL
ncbi:hypothetical protein BT93_H1207 [Corymbia citriodora subsp. variegata]|nr:hypothetical protein BT93_H1207 [Corymbia citriodora subsp. variegata]